MNRRGAILASLAALAAQGLPFSRRPKPKRIVIDPVWSGDGEIEITAGREPIFDLRDPKSLRDFKEFISILSNGRRVNLTITDRAPDGTLHFTC